MTTSSTKGWPLRRDGVTLYLPTASYAKFRLVWRDPLVGGERLMRGLVTAEEAELAFDETVAYVKAARTASPLTANPHARPHGPIVDDLFEELDKRWALKGRSLAYRQGRRIAYNLWVRPVCGHLPVRAWMLDDAWCLQVIADAVAAGRAPATVQNLGALLRVLVSTAHRRRWAAPALNPMAEVDYVARAGFAIGPDYVPLHLRPTTTMVDDLAAAMDDIGAKKGLFQAGDLARVGGYAGLRLSEQTALVPDSHDDAGSRLIVFQAWTKPTGQAATLKRPKNNRPRPVLLARSLNDRMSERAERATRDARADGFGVVPLLFPRHPATPDIPMTEAAVRRLFLAAAREAEWDFDGTRPLIPYRNLRHHAAMWMHDVAGFDWVDVQHALGHHSLSFTLNRYVLPGADADARNRKRLEDL